MAQDIRELLRGERSKISEPQIQEGHQERFLDRLNEKLPQETKVSKRLWLQIAASIIVIFSVGFMTFKTLGTTTSDAQIVDHQEIKKTKVNKSNTPSSLAKISPEYEQVENYLLTSIKFELSQIHINESNKEVVEGFMKRLDNLDQEYQLLNKELMSKGTHLQSVEAMIENLTLRLTLLNRLKNKLKELERIKNDSYTEIQA